MVIKAPAQPEHLMQGHANDLDFPASKLIFADAFGEGASIWQTTIRSTAAVGFWIGSMNCNNTVAIHAYLMLVSRQLGRLGVLEARKGWTDPAWRRKGLGTALLKEAAKISPLLSDTDGMTDMAYAQWQTVAGFKRRWWDWQKQDFVDEADVPPVDRLTTFEDGRRWAMVLTLE